MADEPTKILRRFAGSGKDSRIVDMLSARVLLIRSARLGTDRARQ